MNETTIEEPDLLNFSPVIVHEDADSVHNEGTVFSTWSPINTEQVILSPIIQNQLDPDFGRIHLSWDHSSDLSTPMYNDTEHSGPSILGSDDANAHDLAHSMAEHVLADYEDDVFEDVQLFEDSPVGTQLDQAHNAGAPPNLHLVGDNVQPGRVYRLESRLPVPLDLHLRESEAQPGQIYKLKRLQTDTKTSKKVTKPNKKMKEHKSKKEEIANSELVHQEGHFCQEAPT